MCLHDLHYLQGKGIFRGDVEDEVVLFLALLQAGEYFLDVYIEAVVSVDVAVIAVNVEILEIRG